MRHKAWLLGMMLLASPAQAALPELVDRISVDQPIGCAVFSWMMQDIYRIKLWAKAAPLDQSQPYALSITYNRTLEAKDIAEKSIELMGKLAPGSEAELSDKYLPALVTAMHDVKRGDRITALFTPPETTTFFYNGQQTALIQGRDFISLFGGIWLSPATTQPELRDQLLSNTACKN